ncbi:MAG TPA: carbohydrate ABC transporter permease [Bacilli bacterium]|nr:MAG: Lactose transport system permease protein LacG [Tenericutes bacterium ADurb.BinA124]HOH17806.1 carbohydrate ABC transporter permease [Bacilli bacterium]HPX83672.1 carbohydrate ABC transporter permease [Bacilli bacterium]HQC74940.1 carbohydrate ABC transporter permease [Bacilli bacterium]
MLESKSDKIFSLVVYIILSIFGLSIIMPFLNLLATSLSDQVAVSNGSVSFWPKNFTWSAYQFVIQNNQFWNGLKTTVFVTLVGTTLALMVTTLAAYPLSLPKFKARKFFLVIFIIVMLFNGGLIPTYLLINQLGLRNNRWALILPSLISTYNMLLVKNYFETLPEALYESAKIDGATEFQIFIKITLPLSLPTLATVALFYAVGFWNAYVNGMLYISTPSKMPLQTYLQTLLNMAYIPAHELSPEVAESLSTESIRAATIFSATIPILVLYPFLQKYFVKGLVLGSDK